MSLQMNFKEWIKKDIFGFENDPILKPKPPTDDFPVARLNIEEVIADLRHNVNAKRPIIKFESTSEIQWGETPGALKVTFSPLGAINITVRRLVPDLEGHHRWVCKRVIPVGEQYNKNDTTVERSISEDLMELLTRIDQEGLETPMPGWEGLESFIVRLATAVRKRAPTVLMYEGAKKIDHDRYLIYFSLRGGGVQAKDQKRVEQYIVDSFFKSECGMLKVQGYRVQSRLGKMGWELAVTDFSEIFTPSQKEEEVITAVVNQLARY